MKNTILGNISIGIPVKDNLFLALQTVNRAILIPNVGEILVSINSFSSDLSDLELLKIDSRVRVFIHKENIGLYGNFLFLAQNATLDYFIWNCVDDSLGNSFTKDFHKRLMKHPSSKLFIPYFGTAEFDSKFSKWEPLAKHYLVPPVRRYSDRLRVSRGVEPSWIFGIWNRNYLLGIFPKMPFDWLDVHLLQRVILDGQAFPLENHNPLMVGTTYRYGKTSGAPVASSGHSAWKYFLHSLPLVRHFLGSPYLLARFLLTLLRKFIDAKAFNKLVES